MSDPREHLTARLEECARVIEEAIAAFREDRPLWFGQQAESVLDPNGRPILAGLYGDLASAYAGLAYLHRDSV